MRYPFGLIGGTGLALVLFVLLAWLVIPPEAPEPLEEMTLSLAELPDTPVETQPADTASAPAASLPPPPPAVVPPAPAPVADSAITLPEPELPEMEDPTVELDAPLPELVETPPEPKPKPKPKPEPQPEPKPEPRPQPTPQVSLEPAPSPAPEPAAAPSAQPVAAPSPAANTAPVDVGSSARATRRVPPQYPSRAQRRGLEGYVVVQFLIRPDGSVDTGSIEVLESRPRQVFESAARRAIADWRFETAQGVRRARQKLEFQLR
ncbi:MAG: TonB family protein [Halomonas sp.]|uniref:energy transducer TonB n=1 Tax=Halomonas sp. TaxID=1486246 RepID=UPI003F8DF13B